MIKCHIKRGGKIKISANGPAKDLVPETLLIIQQIYRGIKRDNPEVADVYRRAIIGATLDPDSPVWKDELLDTTENTQT